MGVVCTLAEILCASDRGWLIKCGSLVSTIIPAQSVIAYIMPVLLEKNSATLVVLLETMFFERRDAL